MQKACVLKDPAQFRYILINFCGQNALFPLSFVNFIQNIHRDRDFFLEISTGLLASIFWSIMLRFLVDYALIIWGLCFDYWLFEGFLGAF